MADGSGRAVIVVHCQVDIVKREGAFGEFFADMVDKMGIVSRTKSVLKESRASGVPIFYLRICFRTGYPDLIPNNALLGLVPEKRALLDGEPGAEIIEELTPEEDDVVVDHRRMSGFYGSDLKTVLDKHGVDTLVMTGVATNVSVEATARAGIDLGYNVVVLSDCCTADSQETHDASLGTLGLLASEVTSSEEFLKTLK